MGPHLSALLEAVVGRLNTSRTLSLTQPLIVVFAQLIRVQPEATVSFLEQLQTPSGESGLHLLMNKWCDNQAQLMGAYVNRVCTVALADLLRGFMPQLLAIRVRGERIVADNEGIRTRSRSKTGQVNLTFYHEFCGGTD